MTDLERFIKWLDGTRKEQWRRLHYFDNQAWREEQMPKKKRPRTKPRKNGA